MYRGTRGRCQHRAPTGLHPHLHRGPGALPAAAAGRPSRPDARVRDGGGPVRHRHRGQAVADTSARDHVAVGRGPAAAAVLHAPAGTSFRAGVARGRDRQSRLVRRGSGGGRDRHARQPPHDPSRGRLFRLHRGRRRVLPPAREPHARRVCADAAAHRCGRHLPVRGWDPGRGCRVGGHLQQWRDGPGRDLHLAADGPVGRRRLPRGVPPTAPAPPSAAAGCRLRPRTRPARGAGGRRPRIRSGSRSPGRPG